MVELATTLIIVAAAAAYLVWTLARSARGQGGCGEGCGCSGSAPNRRDRLGTRRDLVSLNVDSPQGPSRPAS